MAQRRNRGRSRRRRAPALPYRRRLGFKPLEDRSLLAALFVNSPLDNTIAGDGLVTLREAILAANNDTTTDLGHKGSFADEITFTLGREGPNTIVLTMGQLTINGDLKIFGSGPDLLTIDASGSDMFPDANNGSGSRVFDILLRTSGGAAANDLEHKFPNVSGNEQQESDHASREPIDLVFAGLGGISL